MEELLIVVDTCSYFDKIVIKARGLTEVISEAGELPCNKDIDTGETDIDNDELDTNKVIGDIREECRVNDVMSPISGNIHHKEELVGLWIEKFMGHAQVIA